MAGFPVGLLATPYQSHVPVLADREDSLDLAAGDVVQYHTVTEEHDGVSVKRPETTGLRTRFCGVMTQALEHGQFSNTKCVREGVVVAKVIGGAAATAGTSLIPTNAKDYFTGTTINTGIELITSCTGTTGVWGPATSTKPKVWIRQGTDWRLDVETLTNT